MEPNNHNAQDGQAMCRRHVQVSHDLFLCSLHVVSHREQGSSGMLASTKDCEAERSLVVMLLIAVLITTPRPPSTDPVPEKQTKQG